MNSLKEDINEYKDENERIKVFLKIKPSIASDKIFYNVSRDKKTISLLDNITLEDQKKTQKIELNKIFLYNDENSYIYEEIMQNCVKDSLEGVNFTFISYGDSNSEKHSLIIGAPDCYENINNKGLLPRLLENYINKIDSDGILSDTISLNISYMLINNNNLIDLSQLMGRERKSLEKITKDELIKKYSREIKVDDKKINYLKLIKKTPILKANDTLFFLLQMLSLFHKLEATSTHFLTWSYFIIIIYVTDNNGKTVSTLTFIIMPGNEILLHKFTKKKNYLGVERKDSISIMLKNNALECSYAVEDIFQNLNIKNINENNKDKNWAPKSKLFSIIQSLSFGVNNKSSIYDRRYVIIGSIFGNSGQITNIKDTLNFLFQCQKFSEIKFANKASKGDFDSTFFYEKLRIKDDQIKDLESKLKTQEAKVDNLQTTLDYRENNILALQDIYRKQIDLLKKDFGFEGEIDNLLSGDIKTPEYSFKLQIRNTTDNNKLKNLKIEELKKQIVKIERDIKQQKILINMRQDHETMLEMIKTIRESKDKKKKENEIRNLLADKIEELEMKNKLLESKILGLKNEINSKKNLLNELPNIFSNNMNLIDNLNKLESKLDVINNDYTMKLSGYRNEGIRKIKSEENKEKNILIDKYENIMQQNKNYIIKIKDKFDRINTNFIKDKKAILDELVLLYKYIIYIIILYRKTIISDSSIFLNKEKFDKILEKEEKNINPFKFPLLFDELGKIGYAHFQLNNKRVKPKLKIIKSKYYKDIKEEDNILEIKDLLLNKNNNKIDTMEKIKKNERIQKIINQIKKGNKINKEQEIIHPVSEIIDHKKIAFHGIVKKNHYQLVSMTIEELQLYIKKFTEKIPIIENFINTYIDNIDNNHEFNPIQEKINEINKKLKILNKKISEVSNKYKNNSIKLENIDKNMQKLKNENYIMKRQLFGIDKKNVFSSISTTSSYYIKRNKFAKRNLSNRDKMKINLNIFKNMNNFNSLTTTSSNNAPVVAGQSTLLTPSKNPEKNINTNINSTIFGNDKFYNTHRSDFFKNRPTSSFKVINPFFLVDNL